MEILMNYLMNVSPRDEFLEEYGKSPQKKSVLRGWIEEYNLTERFAKSDSSSNENLLERIMLMVNFFESMKHEYYSNFNFS